MPAAIFTIALGLRLYGIDWDQGHLFHPDERAILMKVGGSLSFPPLNDLGVLLDAEKSPMNPRWFAYGSFPIYLLETVQSIAGNWTDLDIFDLRLPGRALSALADTGTVIALLSLGTVLYGRREGMLAAGLLAVTVLHIQLSHFFTVDPFMVLFAVLSVTFMARVARYDRLVDSALAGLLLGLALASKASAVALIPPLVLAHLIPMLSDGGGHISFRSLSGRTAKRAIPGLAMDGTLALAAFLTVYLFFNHAYNMAPNIQGFPAPAIAASLFAGAMFLSLATVHLLHAFSEREWEGLLRQLFPSPMIKIVLATVVATLVFFIAMPYAFLDWAAYLGGVGEQWQMSQGTLDYPYTRQYQNTASYLYYIQQVGLWGLGFPLGIVAWAGLLFSGLMALRYGHWGDLLLLSLVMPIFVLVGAQEVKFLRYFLPLTPLLVLMGARLLFWINDAAKSWRYPSQSWIVGLMVVVVGSSALYAIAYDRIYTQLHPASEASAWLQDNVTQGSIVLKEHWEEGIPDTSRYRVQELPLYDPDSIGKMRNLASSLSQANYLLFYSHRLYGTIPRLPERYPLSTGYYKQLFSGQLGYTLERSFTSYPNLLGIALKDDVFTRPGLPVPKASTQESSHLVTVNLGFADESFTVYDHPQVLVFKNEQRYSQDDLFSLILAPLEDQKPPGLMLTSQELRAQRSDRTFSDLFDSDGLTNRYPVVTWLLVVEMLSLVAIPLGFVIFRGLPDRGYLLSKAMGILLLAYIPWLLAALGLLDFTTGSIYLGLVVMAVPASVIGFLKRDEILAFLARRWRILAFQELVFLGAFLAFLALRWANPDLWHPWRGGEKPMDFAYLNALVQSITIPPYDPWFAGGFLNYYYFGQHIIATLIKVTGILPEIAYNLAIPLLFALTVGGAFSVVYNLTESLRERRWSMRGAAWGPAAAGVAAALLVVVVANLDGAIQLIQGAGKVLLFGESFPAFDFWRSTRMMPTESQGITEFPYFTFLFADLHAHLIAIPFTLLVAGLALNLILSAEEFGFRWSVLLLPFAALTLAIGSLAAINTWDYPSYVLLGLASLALSYYAYHRKMDRRLLATILIGGALLVGLSYLAFLPFHQRYVNFNLGVDSSPFQTGLHRYLAIHGLFLFIALSYLFYQAREGLSRLLVPKSGLRSILRRASLLAGVSLAVVAIGLSTGYLTVIVLFVLTTLVVYLAAQQLMNRDDETPHHLFLLGLVGGALALGIVVDVLTVNNDVDRMNTVFKLYIQAWVLFGLASGVILWYLATAWGSPWRNISLGRGVWLATLAILLLGVSIYPVLGTRDRLSDRFSTKFQGLNGTEYMGTTVYRDAKGDIQFQWDRDAIAWLRDNVQGTSVIAEGNTGLYRWGSRISIYTGLPTIIGWDWHQKQQRWGYQDEVHRRIAQVRRLFTAASQEEVLEILREHNVRYVYVGQLERLYYPETGLAKFDLMTNGSLDLVYTNPEVKIYRVNRLES